MIKKRAPISARQPWLEALGRRLVWYFPADQVKEILSDYREQFQEGHDHCRTEAEIIQALGAPAEAAALLLEEEPSARVNGLRQTGLWASVLILCLAFLWTSLMNFTSLGLLWTGVFLGLPLAVSVLFLLIRGPARMALEDGAQRRVSPALVYVLPAVITLAGAVERVVLLILSTRFFSGLPDEELERAGRLLRHGNWLFWSALLLVLSLLALWLLVRSVAASIRYFPGVVHAIGALGSAFFQWAYFSTVYIENQVHPAVDFFLRLLPYCVGLAAALVFRRWVDGSRPLPRCFRSGETSWADWRHRLAVCLLGWYDAPQAMEVLEDYREQYDLAREQGKTETAALSGMGRPETVVRDLLREDRRTRLRRRKTWVWAVLAAFSGWLLLGLLRSFEFGWTGFGWFYSQNTRPISLFSIVLGTIALFFLLHVRERAVVERRFPAPRKPGVWLPLPPLAASALVEGLALWCICGVVLDCRVPVLFGKPVTWFLILSIEFSSLLLALLMIWTLARCVSGSILHFPALPLLAGSFAHVLCVGIYLHSMNMESRREYLAETVRSHLTALSPLLAGLVLAAVLWLILRAAWKKEG